MRSSNRLVPLLALGFAVAVATGCSKRDESLVRIATIGASDALSDLRGPRLNPSAALLRSATTEGLVGFDEEGRVVPALADRWIVTDDGQSYIFRLRNGDWPDGSPITGEAAATALRRALRALRGTPLALDLNQIDEIRAMAGRVVEIRLTSPVPDLLDLLAQPELGLPYKDKGAGPMALERKGSVVQLVPIAPEKRGMQAEEDWKQRVRTLQLRAEPAARAVAAFDDGTVDVVLGGRADTLPLVKTAGLSRGTIRLDPVIGLFGLLFVHDDGFFAEPANREAIAMAIDRAALLDPFNIAGWVPTTRIVSSDVEDDLGTIGERWTGLDVPSRQRIAAQRVSQWTRGGHALAPLRIALPDSPGGAIIFDRLRADLSAIGLSVRKVGEDAPADLRLLDATARYGRATWFLNQLSCAAPRAVCSPEGDARVAEARATADKKGRAALLAEAEAEITAVNGFIPFARPLRWSLVRGDITGFSPDLWGWHPLLPLALAPR
ncbi:ABC transporter substrate-binding protein [Novosphingobium tardum]|uniref:ABC transporter substrate-binding protein n=1 Tax=Novosphingobium tardum TaxID=1538021 RepID=A0ABV8RLK9_9SPHN